MQNAEQCLTGIYTPVHLTSSSYTGCHQECSCKLEANIAQQQKRLYGQDSSLMGLQRCLARLEGFVLIKEQDALKENIAELQKTLDGELQTIALLK